MNRIIKTTSKNKAPMVINVLGSIFTYELIYPSEEIYIFSPWITNISILLNENGKFRGIFPEVNDSDGKLASILNILSRRGSSICILTRRGDQNRYTQDFINQLDPDVRCKYSDKLHEKLFLTDNFFFRGSMNFTYSGAYLNDEHVELTTDPQQVALAFAAARNRWEECE